jgi:hypothetical protein
LYPEFLFISVLRMANKRNTRKIMFWGMLLTCSPVFSKLMKVELKDLLISCNVSHVVIVKVLSPNLQQNQIMQNA